MLPSVSIGESVMKMMSGAFAVTIFSLVLTGCGIHTRSVRLQVPAASIYGGTPSPIILEPSVDRRDLIKAPSSMGHAVSPQLIRAIGEGNAASMIAGGGGGKNAFVVELADGKTVTSTVDDLVSSTLRSHGYEPVKDSPAYSSTPHLRVDVTKFFLYQPFNFFRALTWTMQMKANIETRVFVSQNGKTKTFVIDGNGANIVQTGSDENYIETYSSAMSDYKKKFEADVLGYLHQGDQQ